LGVAGMAGGWGGRGWWGGGFWPGFGLGVGLGFGATYPWYYGYGYPAYAYGYPAYGCSYPAYTYSYPASSYAYPSYSYGYPASSYSYAPAPSSYSQPAYVYRSAQTSSPVANVSVPVAPARPSSNAPDYASLQVAYASNGQPRYSSVTSSTTDGRVAIQARAIAPNAQLRGTWIQDPSPYRYTPDAGPNRANNPSVQYPTVVVTHSGSVPVYIVSR
jgi:hypothetical protein